MMNHDQSDRKVVDWIENDYRTAISAWERLKEQDRSKIHNFDQEGNYICQFYLGRSNENQEKIKQKELANENAEKAK